MQTGASLPLPTPRTLQMLFLGRMVICLNRLFRCHRDGPSRSSSKGINPNNPFYWPWKEIERSKPAGSLPHIGPHRSLQNSRPRLGRWLGGMHMNVHADIMRGPEEDAECLSLSFSALLPLNKISHRTRGLPFQIGLLACEPWGSA